jgi:hypothetical protein
MLALTIKQPLHFIFSLLLAINLTLGGCISVPLSTVSALSRVDRDFYLDLQPELIRVEVISELPIEVDFDSTYIRLNASGRNRPASQVRLYLRKLEETKLPRKNEYTGVFFAPTLKFSYALNEKSIANLANLQREIRSGAVNGISLGVEHSLKTSAPNKASLQILFNQKQGVLKIVNAASYP